MPITKIFFHSFCFVFPIFNLHVIVILKLTFLLKLYGYEQKYLTFSIPTMPVSRFKTFSVRKDIVNHKLNIFYFSLHSQIFRFLF